MALRGALLGVLVAASTARAAEITFVPVAEVLRTKAQKIKGGVAADYHYKGHGLFLWSKDSEKIRKDYVSPGERFVYLISGSRLMRYGNASHRHVAGDMWLTRQGAKIPPSVKEGASPSIGFTIQVPDAGFAVPPGKQPEEGENPKFKSLPELLERFPVKEKRPAGKQRVLMGDSMDVYLVQVRTSAKFPANRYGPYVLYVARGSVVATFGNSSYAASAGYLADIPPNTPFSVANRGGKPAVLLAVGIHPVNEKRRAKHEKRRMKHELKHGAAPERPRGGAPAAR